MWSVFFGSIVFILVLAILAGSAVALRKRGLQSLLAQLSGGQAVTKRPIMIIQRKPLSPQLHLAEIAWGDTVYLLAVQRERVTVIDHIAVDGQNV